MTNPQPDPTQGPEEQAQSADELPKLTAEEWAYIKAVTEAPAKDDD